MTATRLLALCLALAAAFPAHADADSAPPFDVLADVGMVAVVEPLDPDSLYVALGELDGIVRLVDALVVEYRADPRINELFQHTEFGYFKARLIEDLCVRAGGTLRIPRPGPGPPRIPAWRSTKPAQRLRRSLAPGDAADRPAHRHPEPPAGAAGARARTGDPPVVDCAARNPPRRRGSTPAARWLR